MAETPRRKGSSCTCSCTSRLEPIAGFESDPANPGGFLWKVKNGDTALIRVVCALVSSSTACVCTEDDQKDRTITARNLVSATNPGKVTPTVEDGGRTIKVQATAVGQALLDVSIDEVTVECRQIGPAGVPGANPIISVDRQSCGIQSQVITVTP